MGLSSDPILLAGHRNTINKLILGVEIDFDGTLYFGNIPTEFNAKDKYLLKVLLVACKKAITK